MVENCLAFMLYSRMGSCGVYLGLPLFDMELAMNKQQTKKAEAIITLLTNDLLSIRRKLRDQPCSAREELLTVIGRLALLSDEFSHSGDA